MANSNKMDSILSNFDIFSRNSGENLPFFAFPRGGFERDSGSFYIYDLSNITNSQYIDGRPCGRNLCLPRPTTLNFHLWCRFVSNIDKTNNVWQQKQFFLLLSNMTTNVLPVLVVLLGPSI